MAPESARPKVRQQEQQTAGGADRSVRARGGFWYGWDGKGIDAGSGSRHLMANPQGGDKCAGAMQQCAATSPAGRAGWCDLTSRHTRESGVPVRCALSVQAPASLEYWITRWSLSWASRMRDPLAGDDGYGTIRTPSTLLLLAGGGGDAKYQSSAWAASLGLLALGHDLWRSLPWMPWYRLPSSIRATRRARLLGLLIRGAIWRRRGRRRRRGLRIRRADQEQGRDGGRGNAEEIVFMEHLGLKRAQRRAMMLTADEWSRARPPFRRTIFCRDHGSLRCQPPLLR